MEILQGILLSFLVLGFQDHVSAGCTHGWVQHNDYCYLFSHDKATWFGALAFCSAMDASLADIRTQDVEQFLESSAQQHNDKSFWVGGSDIVEEGKWEWITSKDAFTYTHWKSGEPDGQEDEDCLQINSDHQWTDDDCSDDHRFICQTLSSYDKVIIG